MGDNVKVKINKLFGKYNNELNLDNQCSIYIGENGIGKSTSIKIFNALFKYNYIELLKYYFESIDIIDDNDFVKISYTDLILNDEYFLKEVCKSFNAPYDEVRNGNYIDNVIGPFDAIYSKSDCRLLYKILKNDKNILNNESFLTEYDLSEVFIDYLLDIYKKADVNKTDSIYYIDSNISFLHKNVKKILSKIKYDNVYMINLANDYVVTNKIFRKYGFNKSEELSFSEEYKKIIEHNKNADSFLDKKTPSFQLSKNYSGYLDRMIINKLIESYEVKKKIGLVKNELDLGYYLFTNIYDDKKIKIFKEDFYEFLNDNIGKFKDKKNRIESDLYNYLKMYLYPLIPELNPLNVLFTGIRNEENEFFVCNEELNLVNEFYKKYKDKYFNIRNEKLIKLNKLFKKYFKNKNVIATPFGISISSKGFDNDINYEELSSGEKKLIILFVLTIFNDNSIILLDEPETSLSVVWQEDLLIDIMNNSNINKLIVASQSPYIVSSEIFDDCIVPLFEE